MLKQVKTGLDAIVEAGKALKALTARTDVGLMLERHQPKLCVDRSYLSFG